MLHDMAGGPVSNATVKLRATTGSLEFTATTTTSGEFSFAEIAGGTYSLLEVGSASSVTLQDRPGRFSFR
jgi:hypothetical protein